MGAKKRNAKEVDAKFYIVINFLEVKVVYVGLMEKMPNVKFLTVQHWLVLPMVIALNILTL
jgi:hypothetical protein